MKHISISKIIIVWAAKMKLSGGGFPIACVSELMGFHAVRKGLNGCSAWIFLSVAGRIYECG